MFSFSLDAQVNGPELSVSAEEDGLGITVRTASGPQRARSWNEAIRIVRDEVGGFLARAQRGGIPWGLRVTVPDGTAVYGEWPLVGGGGGGSPSFQNTALVRIRNRWSDSGALSALENAIQIVREYAPARRAAA